MVGGRSHPGAGNQTVFAAAVAGETVQGVLGRGRQHWLHQLVCALDAARYRARVVGTRHPQRLAHKAHGAIEPPHEGVAD